MKKQGKGFLAGILVTILALGLIGTAAATVGRYTVDADYSDIKVTLDGNAVTLVDANGAAVEPFAINGTTYLPVRAVANALGLEVGWDAATSTVQLTTPGQSAQAPAVDGAFQIGQTWTVPGQWEVTVTGITETKDRNKYSDKNPVAVYVIDYTYKNLGYVDSDGIMDGLYISLSDGAIVDSTGLLGYEYPGGINYPQETPVGATCKAQACVGVDNAGPFTIQVFAYDGNDVKQSATFALNP